jgi:hypothetical protein
VRAAWLGERRAKLAEFDRLTGKGMSGAKAARRLGLGPGGIEAMRRSVELMEEGRQYGAGQGTSIDLGLALLSCLRKPGQELTCADIAAWCDCSRQSIGALEKRAVRKFRQRFMAQVADPEIVERLNALLSASGGRTAAGKEGAA